MSYESEVSREPVIKDCYDKLLKALSRIDEIKHHLDECDHIINKNFNEFEKRLVYTKYSPEPNLKYGMTKLADTINDELDVIGEKVAKIIYSLVFERPKRI